jgi:hypothetical protein
MMGTLRANLKLLLQYFGLKDFSAGGAFDPKPFWDAGSALRDLRLNARRL